MAGYTELLQRKASSVVDEKSNHYMAMMVESAKRMGNLIDDLLAFSRIGRAETQKTLVSLAQLVREALPKFGKTQRDETLSGKSARCRRPRRKRVFTTSLHAVICY
jgi:light-regulated signal transduction histidine kinase (bacteriophytochrome)